MVKMIAIILVVASIIPILGGSPKSIWFVVGFAFLISLGSFAVVLGIIALQQRRFTRSKINAPFIDDTRYVVSTVDGIRQTLQCGVDSFIPWSVISRVSVKPKWVEFWFMTGAYFLVPLEAFESPQIVEQIKKFAENESLTARLQ